MFYAFACAPVNRTTNARTSSANSISSAQSEQIAGELDAYRMTDRSECTVGCSVCYSSHMLTLLVFCSACECVVTTVATTTANIHTHTRPQQIKRFNGSEVFHIENIVSLHGETFDSDIGVFIYKLFRYCRGEMGRHDSRKRPIQNVRERNV